MEQGVVGRWLLALDDGTTRDLTGQVIVGRDPSGDEAAGRVGTTVWAVEDPDKSLSKTHAVFGADGPGVWVEDQHSTNGVVVVSAAGSRELAPGERTTLEANDRIQLGERVIVLRSTDGD